MSGYTEHIANGKQVITHPTGIVCEYDEQHLHELFEKVQKERDAANEELVVLDELIAEVKESKKEVEHIE